LESSAQLSSAQLSSIGNSGDALTSVREKNYLLWPSRTGGLKTCQFEAGFSGFICNRFLPIVNMSTWSFISQGNFIDSLHIEGYVNFLGFLLKEVIISYIFLNT